jgi:multidrug efflux system outer membrane protein
MSRQASFLFLLVFSACAVGPDYSAPKPDLPLQWEAEVSGEQATEAELAGWWQGFHDPLLAELVERMIAANRDLRQASLRIFAARESITSASARLLPSVTADAQASRTRGTGAGGEALYRSISDGGLDAIWEIDLFGGIRRGRESSIATLESVEESFNVVRLELVAQLVTAYLQFRATQQQILILEKILSAQQTRHELAQERLKNGLDDTFATIVADSQLATLTGDVRGLEAQREELIFAIGVLAGEKPETLRALLLPPQDIPQNNGGDGVSLPAEVIARRPDVRRAAAELHAKTAAVGVATAALLPQLTLSGSFSLQESSATTNPAWSLIPVVAVPIFNAGRLRAAVRISEAQQESAVQGYEGTVLSALREIETALVHYGREQQRLRSLNHAVTQSQRALAYATELYSQGLTDYIRVLQAQQALLSAQQGEITARLGVGSYRVALFKALGGGW